jgi:hypothetical protein
MDIKGTTGESVTMLSSCLLLITTIKPRQLKTAHTTRPKMMSTSLLEWLALRPNTTMLPSSGVSAVRSTSTF